ncbi:MAG: C4-dicarboxylate ABC transporter, partial [Mesorhizobium sp.]
FWDEIAATGDRPAKVVKILRDYREVMTKAGPPYRYG